VRYCVMIEGQEGVRWTDWLALARACESLDYEGLFTSDHYYSVQGARDRGSNDAWAMLAGLAAVTERIRLGTLVSPVTFRLPAVLAKNAVTVDHISGGRVELGMGAGWWTEEHRTHGFPFPPTVERFERLSEQLEIVHGLFSEEEFTFEGSHYALEGCRFTPKPVQQPHLPIIIGGGGGPRMAKLVATWADEFNTYHAMPSEVQRRYEGVRRTVESSGRDPASVTMSLMHTLLVGSDEADFRARARRLAAADPDVGPDADLDDYIADLDGGGAILGSPDRAAARLSELAEAGVERIMLQHLLHDDLEMLEIVAREVLPKVG
jgi:F420-dependent oxidoreductase-like protein